MSQKDDREALYPHAPDVLERETSDGGFSSGWGMHFMPLGQRIVDMHGHIQFRSFENAEELVRRHGDLVKPLNISRSVACLPVMAVPLQLDEPLGFSIQSISGIEKLAPYFDTAKKSGTLSLMLFPHHGNPDVSLITQGAAMGACAVKLHNAPIIVNAADPELWLEKEWSEVFAEIQRLGLPVLWHVTQRLTNCAYTGGGRNSYWKDGWKKGVTFTNEDLLQIFLKVVKKYPGIPFLSAHQLHLGWDRLGKLFGEYPNLYTDTSVGCYLMEGDRMYEDDIRRIRDFFIRYKDRILFGTDYFITDVPSGSAYFPDNEKKEIIKSHIRFIKQLRLPDEALQKVFHGNAARLLRLDAAQP